MARFGVCRLPKFAIKVADPMPIEPERTPMRTSRTAEAIHHLKEEIDKLTEQQTEALNLAIYVGMTPDEAAEYDERRSTILQYVQDLKTLEESL